MMGVDYGAERGGGIALAEVGSGAKRARESAPGVQSRVGAADVSRETLLWPRVADSVSNAARGLACSAPPRRAWCAPGTDLRPRVADSAAPWPPARSILSF